MEDQYEWTEADLLGLLDRMTVTEAVEFRLDRGTELVLTFRVGSDGCIYDILDNGRGGPKQSLSNLQLENPVPRKAVPGWQREAYEAAQSGLWTVTEVR
jgi:hypothetical protein